MSSGDNSNNVIDLAARRGKQTKVTGGASLGSVGEVVDMTSRRQEILNQERREKKRTVLTEFISAFVVVPRQGLHRVNIYDISEGGIGFDVDFDVGCFRVNEEVALRFYLSQDAYFPFTVKINNTRHLADEGIYRHGTKFVVNMDNEQVLSHLVQFIESVSPNLQQDKGDMLILKGRRY